MAFATRSEVNLAVALGYTVTIRAKDGTTFEIPYKDGIRRIWGIHDGWQTADLINGIFTNHKTYDYADLSSALRRFWGED